MTERRKPGTDEAIPAEHAIGHWRPVAYTTEEGGAWTPIEDGIAPVNYSSLAYKNGWIFDNVLKQMNVNPWRHVEDEISA